VGEWKNNQRHGYGEFYNPDKSILKANWVNDKQDGPAIIMLVDSSTVHCNWKLGVIDSVGSYYKKKGEFLRYFKFNAK
jgi:hypothetical protein